MKGLFFFFSLTMSSGLLAENVVSFEKDKTYQIEGTIEQKSGHKFLVFNLLSSNEQRIKLKTGSDLIQGAQYRICIQVLKDCHMECEAQLFGTPTFISPERDPHSMIPDTKGKYAPVASALCP